MTDRTLPLTERPAWSALGAHKATLTRASLRKLFADDPGRGERLVLEAAGVFLDYSKNLVTEETLRLLLQLARESGLPDRIAAMFRGDPINVSENRPALHVALRAPRGADIRVNGEKRRTTGTRRARQDDGVCDPGA